MLTSDEVRGIYLANKAKGFHDDKNTNEYKKPIALMLVITELAEAVEALRANKFANVEKFRQDECDKQFTVNFLDNIKDTFEDELADAIIRLYDYSGMQGFDFRMVTAGYNKEMKEKSINLILDKTAAIFNISKEVTNIYYCPSTRERILGETVAKIELLAKKCNIDIDFHIKTKLKYNQTRPLKHGKTF